MTETANPQTNLSLTNSIIVEQNVSLVGDHKCIPVILSQMEFLPWDNRDNLISEETETVVYRIKNNLLVLLFLIGGPANVINMVVFYKHGLRDRVNLCLFALSLADEIHLTISTLTHGEQVYVQFTAARERFGLVGIFVANNNLLVFISATYVSHLLSAIVATERCLCVVDPLKFQTLLRTRTMAAIIAVTSVVIFTLYFFVAFRYHVGCFHDPVTGVVIKTFVDGKFYARHKEFINRLHSFVFGLSLPAIETMVVTTATIITVIKLRQVMTWRSEMTSSRISAKEVAVTKTLVCVSVFFIACITPVTLIRFSNLFFSELKSGRRYHNLYLAGVWITEMFSSVNSTFNFFVYFVMASRFRKTFWTLCGRERKGKDGEKR